LVLSKTDSHGAAGKSAKYIAIDPALQRLEQRGFIESDWAASDNTRRARYYSITRLGRKALGEEVAKWRGMSAVHRTNYQAPSGQALLPSDEQEIQGVVPGQGAVDY